MNAKLSLRRQKKEQPGRRTGAGWEPETGVFALLGVAAAAAIALAVVSASLPARPPQLGTGPESSSMAQDPGSGPLVADMRTPSISELRSVK